MMNSVMTNPIQVSTFLICLVTAMILGVLTALVFFYRSRHSVGFAISLAILPMVVCIIIMMVNGNIGTGIAVAGAFTLVRFRSVPGKAIEIAALFVAMAIGLILGMGYIGVAVMFFALAAVFVLVLTRVNFGAAGRGEKQMKITIPENLNYDGLFDDLFKQYTNRIQLRQIRSTNMGTLFELTYDVVFKDASVPKEFIDDVRSRNGNLNIIIGDLTEGDVL